MKNKPFLKVSLFIPLIFFSCTTTNFKSSKALTVDLNVECLIDSLRVKQLSNRDCNIASLAGVLAYWGSDITQEEIKNELGRAPVSGYSLFQLKEFAEKKEFLAFVLTGDFSLLKYHTDLNRPVIIIVKSSIFRNHSLVVYKVIDKGSKYNLNIMDPSSGQLFTYSSTSIEDSWRRLGYPIFLVGKAM